MWRIIRIVVLSLFFIAGLAGQDAAAHFSGAAPNASNAFATGTWTTVYLYPNVGKDKTRPKVYNLNSAELACLQSSEDTWYEVQAGWPTAYGPRRLDLRFPDIPDDATVTGVTVTVEWAWLSNLTDPGTEAEVKLQIDDVTWQAYNLTPPLTGYADVIETIDISDFVKTADHVNYLQAILRVKFTSGPPEGIKTRHDLVEVKVVYK